MSKKNVWVCDKNVSFGIWLMKFPLPEVIDKAYLLTLLEFMREVLAIAEEYQVLQIDKTSLHTLGIPEMSYIEQMRWLIEQQNYLPFFGYLDSHIRGHENVSKSGLISYYNEDGIIVSNQIDNVADLFKTLRPESTYFDSHIPLHTSPIDIRGHDISIGEDYGLDIRAYIRLYTDIWFPKTLGLKDLTDDILFWEDASYVDNLELARIHTPRLNLFLQKAKNLTIKFGGKWALLDPDFSGAEMYEAMLAETGIRLG